MLRFRLPVLLLACLASRALAVTIPANDPHIQYSGRVDFSDPLAPKFDWPGVNITAVFQGPSIGVLLKDGLNNYNVIIDGALKQVLVTTKTATRYDITDLSNATHTFVLAKRTESTHGSSSGIGVFNGFVLASGGLLAPEAKATRRIEVFGDSLSAGYGIDAKSVKCADLKPYANHYLSYDALAARNFCAELHVEAVSGIRLTDNGGAIPLPVYVPRTVAGLASPLWDWASWIPDVVLIRLGTNDFRDKKHPPSPAQYEAAYHSFIATIRGHYPAARIFCLAAKGDGFRPYVQRVVDQELKAGNSNLQFVGLPDLWTADLRNFGCDYHPGAAGAKLEAEALISALEKGMGWKGCAAIGTASK
jgi:lysophospholipase L1-like esterase